MSYSVKLLSSDNPRLQLRTGWGKWLSRDMAYDLGKVSSAATKASRDYNGAVFGVVFGHKDGNETYLMGYAYKGEYVLFEGSYVNREDLKELPSAEQRRETVLRVIQNEPTYRLVSTYYEFADGLRPKIARGEDFDYYVSHFEALRHDIARFCATASYSIRKLWTLTEYLNMNKAVLVRQQRLDSRPAKADDRKITEEQFLKVFEANKLTKNYEESRVIPASVVKRLSWQDLNQMQGKFEAGKLYQAQASSLLKTLTAELEHITAALKLIGEHADSDCVEMLAYTCTRLESIKHGLEERYGE